MSPKYYNEEEKLPTSAGRKLGCAAAVVVAILILFIMSIVTIPAGNVGIVTRMGAVNRVLQPGFSLKIPWPFESVHKMNTQVQKWEQPMDAASSDLQTVTTTVAVNYNLVPSCATRIYQEYGLNVVDKVMVPAVFQTVKDVTSKHAIDNLIRDRETPRRETQERLAPLMSTYCITIIAVNMTDFNPSEKYSNAIEDKQVAQQQAEQAKQVLAKAKIDAETAAAKAQGEADAQVIQAEAEAKSIDLRGAALARWPEVIRYQFVQQLNSVDWGILSPDLSTFMPITPAK